MCLSNTIKKPKIEAKYIFIEPKNPITYKKQFEDMILCALKREMNK